MIAYDSSTALELVISRLEGKMETTTQLAFLRGIETKRLNKQNIYRDIENSLYARQHLLDNIAEYKAEIENIDNGITSDAKSPIRKINKRFHQIADSLYVDARIETLNQKILRDEAKLREIKRGLDAVKNDRHYHIIEQKYFDRIPSKVIADKTGLEHTFVVKKCFELIKIIAVKLYGADSL
jgi:hypothetical protein